MQDDSDFEEIAECTQTKLFSSLTKVGYSDGKSAGRDSAFQGGFDEGYKVSLKIAIQLSAFKSFAEIMSQQNANISEELLKESQSFLKSSYTNYENILKLVQNDSQSVNEISQLQNLHIEKVIQELETNFPIISSFINIK